jgi:hypothetical protein
MKDLPFEVLFQQVHAIVMKGYYVVAVISRDHPSSGLPRQRFGPFLDATKAEKKKTELESLVQERGWSVVVQKKDPLVGLSAPDDPLVDELLVADSDGGDDVQSEMDRVEDSLERVLRELEGREKSGSHGDKFWDYFSKVHYTVTIHAEGADSFQRPEKQYGPFWDLADAESKKSEIERICRERGWRKTVSILTLGPLQLPSPRDEP